MQTSSLLVYNLKWASSVSLAGTAQALFPLKIAVVFI